MDFPIIEPQWPAPPNVRAAVTTRQGGVGAAPFDTFNLATHVEDDPHAVAVNRQRLRMRLGLPNEPLWLSQVHGVAVVDAEGSEQGCAADGAYALRPGVVCAAMTADCLPVLFASRDGTRVAAAHAGWRGLVNGVLEATVAALALPGAELLAWLGPAIGPDVFEVGEEVRAAFLAHDPRAEAAFQPSPAGRWLADIYHLARLRLEVAGVGSVHGGDFCTFSDRERFFSYRREARTGRMASLIWIQPR